MRGRGEEDLKSVHVGVVTFFLRKGLPVFKKKLKNRKTYMLNDEGNFNVP